VQAVEQPHKVAVSTDNLAASPRTVDLVVVMLEHEYTLFLGK
jgi:hypothetical protein